MDGFFQRFGISRNIGRFTAERRLALWLVAATVAFAAFVWIRQNPQHNPLAPLDLRDPPGWATDMKLLDAIEDPRQCRAVLQASGISFTSLAPKGEGDCAQTDRVRLRPTALPLAPGVPVATCPVSAGMAIWFSHGLQQAAQQHLGARVVRIEHGGTASCRRVNGQRSGPWSEHASGNAIDIRAFILSDGRRIGIRPDWGRGVQGDFLKAARSAACSSFRTVMSPDYGAEQAGSLHLDQGTRWSRVCR